jgi:hypothetical protein
MAAFNPKPWFKQPANSDIKLRKNFQIYYQFDIEDIFVSDIPKTITPDNELVYLHNISISYELFNDIIIWGLVKFPKLHKFFLDKTEIHGTKISFGDNTFKPLSKKHQFKLLKDIHPDDIDYKKLSVSQQYISNLINNYNSFKKKINNKYLSICNTIKKDRYNDFVFDKTIISYPDHKENTYYAGFKKIKRKTKRKIRKKNKKKTKRKLK